MRIKELINSFRNRGDPCAEIDLDMDRIMEAAGESVDVYENVYLNRDVFLRLILVSGKGVFVVAPFRRKAVTSYGREIRKLLGICAVNSMVVFYDGAGVSVLSWEGMNVLPADDLYVLLRDFHHDTKAAPYDGWSGIRMLDAESADRIRGLLEPLENVARPEADMDEMVDEEGQAYVKRYESVSIGPFDTGLAGRQRWYPVAEINTDVQVAKAVFGGWFGLHRFSQGEIGTGILYALTCGCIGVLPALDIVQYLTGSMYFFMVSYSGERDTVRKKEKVYLRKPVNKGWAAAGIVVSLLIAAAAWKFLYRGLGSVLIECRRKCAGRHGRVAPCDNGQFFMERRAVRWRQG